MTGEEFVVLYEGWRVAHRWGGPERLVQWADWKSQHRPETGPDRVVTISGRIGRPLQAVRFQPEYTVGVVLQ